MSVSFENISTGSLWQRHELAKLWGYADFHAIARGVVTPRNSNFIVLFVQEEKPEDFTQYANRLEGRRLQWEGEKGHGSDQRIAGAETAGDEIHVFYRKVHRSPYTYLGKVRLLKFEQLSDAPSRAEFELAD